MTHKHQAWDFVQTITCRIIVFNFRSQLKIKVKTRIKKAK